MTSLKSSTKIRCYYFLIIFTIMATLPKHADSALFLHGCALPLFHLLASIMELLAVTALSCFTLEIHKKLQRIGRVYTIFREEDFTAFSGNFHCIYSILFILCHCPYLHVWGPSFFSNPSIFNCPSTHSYIFEFHSICVPRAFRGKTNLSLSFLLTLWSELESQAIDFCLCIVLIYRSSVIFQKDKGPLADGGFPLSDRTPAQLLGFIN